MKKNLQSAFHTRQYMLSKDFEIYYYSDYYLSKVESHTHNYYEFYFFLEGNVDMIIEGDVFSMHPGDLVLIPPKIRHHAEIRNQELPYRRFVFWISREYCKRLLNCLRITFTLCSMWKWQETMYFPMISLPLIRFSQRYLH